MDALKLKRTPLRTTFTKAVNSLQEISESTPLDTSALETVFEQLVLKGEKLKDIDGEILQCLIDSKCDQDSYNKEFESIESYSEKLISWKIKVKHLLNDSSRNKSKIEDHNESGNIEARSLVNMRLPKITFHQFSGELTEWFPFWNQFKRIHEDENIEDVDKFQFLVQSTTPKSKAREIVDSFPATSENYKKAVEYLKKRFGQEDMLIQVYVRELLKLVLQNNDSRRSSLSSLYDKIEAQLRALESLGVTKDKYASMLFPMVESCLPSDILRAWERYDGYSSDESGKKDLDSLMKFLSIEVSSEDRIKLARTGFESGKVHLKKRIANNVTVNAATAADLFNASTNDKKEFKLKVNDCCIFCEKLHASENCFEAASMSFDFKKEAVMKKGVCFICLKKGHRSNCCRSKVKCIICGKRHFAVMCSNLPPKSGLETKNDKTETANSTCSADSSALANQACATEVLLQTLVVKLQNGNKERLVRAIIDTGSSKSYILKSTAEELGFNIEREEEFVHTLFGGIKTKMCKHKSYRISLSDLDNKYSCKLDVYDQEIICNEVPRIRNGPWINELKNKIRLTDFGEDSGPIEILIGADVAGKLLTGQIIPLESGPVAIQTKLGWTLMGKIPHNKDNENNPMTITSLFVNELTVSDLWKLDTLGITDPAETKTKLEIHEQTLNHFRETVCRDSEGRYEIALPWVLDNKLLPSNKKLAENRLTNIRKKLLAVGKFNDYQVVFDNWLEEGIIEEVSDNIDTLVHYLPHRPVIKESSSTSKIRPVFDASAHSKGSPSLNDCLEKGPNLIEIIPTIVNRFRRYKIGVVSDIEKAFLQISIREQDRNFLRFLWYDKENLNHIKTYRHRRVVFGVTSSPFLLGATLNYHLDNAPENLSNTAGILRKSFYVDNCVTSFETGDQLERFIVESQILLSAARFNLRGWQSNAFVDAVRPPESLEQQNNCETMVLGLIWHLKDDTLSCKINYQSDKDKLVTKRSLLSVTNHVFDPIGFTAPVTLIPKLILQEIWKLKIKWDEKLPDNLLNQFRKWIDQLSVLANIEIPRCLNLCSKENNCTTVHIFCDASKKAYAACIFLRVESSHNVYVKLIQAKSRVAPLKAITIPRLELMSCCIGSRLAASIRNDLNLSNERFFYWSDSTTALAWIQRDIQWGVFVLNRVKEIREISNISDWGHVPSDSNPDDILSRGCSAEKLMRLKWWEGPSWLYKNENEWPKSEFISDEEEINSERRKTVLVNTSRKTEIFDWHFKYFSSYIKLIRMFAWLLRFLKNARKTDINKSADISCSEFEDAEKVVLKLIQKDTFQGETDEKLRPLKPIVDEFGILRARTKLIFREDSDDFKYPVILPGDHPVVHLMIIRKHEELMHAGVSIVMTHLREKFWILKARRSVRQTIHKCVRCRRFTAQKTEVIPSSLPGDRVCDAKVFQIIGTDLAGPLHLKGGQKSWVVLFTCAVYRAVHLELITSLSTPAFLQSFRRFISRRGRPSVVYSDNGTNYVGTNNALRSIDWDIVRSNTAIQKIRWKFNPPAAPWWGGFWERIIQMLKQVLRKVLGKASLSYEELNTILCDCEYLINSRPLTYVSEDVEDLAPLTPAMFLQEIHTSDVTDIDILDNKEMNKRIKHRQKVREHLRKRFRIEYLGQLREQTQRYRISKPLRVGDVVLIENDHKKRAFWSLARIATLIPGKDGHHRVAKIKTVSGELVRPVQKLYNLEIQEPESCVLKEKIDIHNRKGRKITKPERLTYS